MKRDKGTVRAKWDTQIVTHLLAHVYNRLLVQPESQLLQFVVKERYTEAVNYSVLVEKFPWYTQEGASYILGKCLRRFEGREGLPLWQKASKVLMNFYFGKTLTDFQKDKRWNLASAYEEAMKKYNPDPKPRSRRSQQPSPLPKIPNAQCAQFGI